MPELPEVETVRLQLKHKILGKIVEFSTKRTYSEVANELFKELKMNNTFCYSKSNNQNLVSGYLNNNNTFKMLENKLINSENM